MTLRKISAMILIATFALFTTGQTALAETPSIGESDATVKFKAGTGIPDVVDPTDPTDPFEPEEPNPTDPPTENAGPLSLDYVSSIDFGEQYISAETKVYNATSLKPFIQVTDNRGTGQGWKVTAAMSGFTYGDVEPSLQGSVVTLTGGEALSPVNSPATPFSEQSVVLTADNVAAKVVSAAEDTGLGTWINRWFPSGAAEENRNDNVTLEVPGATAMQGVHTATITWTLTDAPGQ